MSTAELIQVLILGTLALGSAVALTVGFAGGLHFEPLIRKLSSAWLPTILLFALGASTLISGRNASLYGVTSNLVTEGASGYSGWVLRLSTAFTVGMSALMVASALLGKKVPKNAARPLFLAFSLYFFATYVVSGIFGTEFSISHKTFYPFLVVFALYVTSEYDEALFLRLMRDGLLVFLVVGLCMIPIRADLVMQKNYQGFIPGLSSRYWGLASHANNIGPLAVFFMLVTYWVPYRKWFFALPAIGVAVLTLVLAQSKTALVSAVIVAGVFVVRLWFNAIFGRGNKRNSGVLALAALLVITALVLVIFVADIYTRPLENLLLKIQGRGTFLTGRENIWSITIAQWHANPLFGYGPSLWGEEFTARYGYLGIASNAHNQFFDVLGSSGIFGVAAFVVYVLVLCQYAIRLAGPSKWISIAMLLFIAIRCVSEVPLKTMNITTSDFIMHAVLLGLFMRAAVRNEKSTQQTTPPLPARAAHGNTAAHPAALA